MEKESVNNLFVLISRKEHLDEEGNEPIHFEDKGSVIIGKVLQVDLVGDFISFSINTEGDTVEEKAVFLDRVGAILEKLSDMADLSSDEFDEIPYSVSIRTFPTDGITAATFFLLEEEFDLHIDAQPAIHSSENVL